MENRSHALVALIFLIVLFLGSGAAAWWMQSGRAEVKQYKIISPYGVSGLQVQAPVNFKGIQVGTVRKVELDPQNPEKVLIHIGLIGKTPVTQATYAQLSSNGITGVSSISLHEKREHAPPLPTTKDHLAEIPLERGLMQQLETSGKKIVSHTKNVTEQIQHLLDKQNAEHINHTLAQIDAATKKLNTLEDRLIPVIQQLPALLDSAQETIDQGPGLMRQSRSDARKLHTLLDSLNHMVVSLDHNTVPKINDLAEQLDQTTRNVDELTRSLQQDPGKIIFGGSNPPPGPGEPGYHSPQ